MTVSTDMFPDVLVRISSENYSQLRRTDIRAAYTLVQKIIRHDHNLTAVADAISQALFILIPKMAPEERRFWITARRQIHQKRPVGHVSPKLRACLPSAQQKQIERYESILADLQKMETAFAQQYQQDLHDSKTAFATLLNRKKFQNALLLSSATITDSLADYLTSGKEHTAAISKKERSFMEYLSRMYTKPSPFSSFTHLGIATVGETAPGRLIALDTYKTYGRIQLNHDLYKYLVGLIVSRKDMHYFLPLALNRTITKDDEAYTFLTNHHNREAFQRITTTPALDIFYQLLARNPQPYIYYGVLLKEILNKRYINAAPAALATYLDQLIELGFVELAWDASGIDRDWDKKFSRQLLQIPNSNPHLRAIVDGLAAGRKLAEQYERARSLSKRQNILDEGLSVFKQISETLGAATPKETVAEEKQEQADVEGSQTDIFRHTYTTEFTYSRNRLWYEDTALAGKATLSDRLTPNLEALKDLLVRMGRFDNCQQEQENMTDFFKRTYGSEATISVLRFYQDYSRAKNNDELATPAPQTTRRKKQNQKLVDTFMQQIGEQPVTGEVHFDQAAISHIARATKPSSFGAFFQAYETIDGPQLVVNSPTEGNGKMLSRFLYLFDDAITHRLQQAYAHRKDALLAEVTDASVFNANLHPRIMPYEIITPGGHPSLPPSAQLAVEGLDIRYHAGQRRLMLVDRSSGKKIFTADLGFQGKRGRSKLYDLLCQFGPGESGPHHNANALTSKLTERFTQTLQDGITVRPRITYKRCIMLQRKSWHIPKDALPSRRGGESDPDYFLRLNQWRHSLEIPEEVFVRGAHYKPQYISFRNPFLIALLESNIRRCKETLDIEEMLPNGKQIAPTGGRVMEYLTQWYV